MKLQVMLTVSATDRVVMQDEAMLDLEGMGNPVSVSSSDRVVMQVDFDSACARAD